uniref:Uncharacterized protein n=1 Tax=Oryza sativa subsp. japonica TaxID=39947 RepID=Q6ZGJ5_ORYSJ|nr:hypothetical protein [Oryza sativa Japonica Group]BAD16937.1 hypothetical protein [Oryza sativa Japonica Group]
MGGWTRDRACGRREREPPLSVGKLTARNGSARAIDRSIPSCAVRKPYGAQPLKTRRSVDVEAPIIRFRPCMPAPQPLATLALSVQRRKAQLNSSKKKKGEKAKLTKEEDGDGIASRYPLARLPSHPSSRTAQQQQQQLDCNDRNVVVTETLQDHQNDRSRSIDRSINRTTACSSRAPNNPRFGGESNVGRRLARLQQQDSVDRLEMRRWWLFEGSVKLELGGRIACAAHHTDMACHSTTTVSRMLIRPDRYFCWSARLRAVYCRVVAGWLQACNESSLPSLADIVALFIAC